MCSARGGGRGVGGAFTTRAKMNGRPRIDSSSIQQHPPPSVHPSVSFLLISHPHLPDLFDAVQSAALFHLHIFVVVVDDDVFRISITAIDT